MPIYLDQIEKRRRLEEAALGEALANSQRRMGFKSRRKAQPQDDNSALRQVRDALGVTDYELEENEMLSPEEMLTGILRPRGIMMRKIKLSGKWWRESVGPLLGHNRDGRLVALIPTNWNLGYTYRNQEGETIKVRKRDMRSVLTDDALTFTKPLPLKKLRLSDLMRFCWQVVPRAN